MLALAGLLLFSGCQQTDAPAETEEPDNPYAYVYEDVTAAAGLGNFVHETGAAGEFWFPETVGAGGAFFDYDGDGWLDLLLVAGAHWEGYGEPIRALQLYRNTGAGTFEDVTEAAGLADVVAYGFGVLAADYDNDGDQDFFFTTLHQNYLFQNNDGRFTDVTGVAGLSVDDFWSTTAIFFDADNDGWLDLYVGNYVRWLPELDQFCTLDEYERSYCAPQQFEGEPAQFYHNNGDGTFTDRTIESGMTPTPGKTLGVTELDVNQDGWSDLVVANDTQRNLLYVNNGDGTFEEQGLVAGIAFDENGVARAGMGIDSGDIENNGQDWVFIGTFAHEMIGVFKATPNGFFLDRSAASLIGRQSLQTLNFGLFLYDAEYDGDLDMLVANGHIYPAIEKVENAITYRQPTQLFINEGDGTFTDVMPEIQGVWAKPLVARGAIFGDYDRDGDVDVLLTENGGPIHLWKNNTVQGNYLRVRLQGTESNADGLGARIVAYAGELTMQRRVRTGGTYMSQSELTASFGVAAYEQVDSLVVYWPSGIEQKRYELPVNDEILVVEGQE